MLRIKQQYIENALTLTPKDLLRASIAAWNAGQGKVVKTLNAGGRLEDATYNPNWLDTIYAAAAEYETV
jgi:hypothetical protein